MYSRNCKLLFSILGNLLGTENDDEHYKQQAGRRLVRSLLTVCDIGVSLHPWAYVDNK